MGDKTGISWTDATWNPLAGCSPVSEGCRNCYAAREAIRLAGNPNPKVAAAYGGTAEMRGAGLSRRAVFTGRVNLLHDRLDQPLRWKRPRRIFVNSMSDLFHEEVPDDFIDTVFTVMMKAPHHVFQVLTKRPDRMAEFLGGALPPGKVRPVLRNVWLGTSVENQAAADERVPHLLRTPAAVRWVSCEPLLGPVDLRSLPFGEPGTSGYRPRILDALTAGSGSETPWHLNWVVAGGESGPKARPMHSEWARSLRDQCQGSGVPFHFKQWGEWAPCPEDQWHGLGTWGKNGQIPQQCLSPDGETAGGFLGGVAAADAAARGWRPVQRVGKTAAGRLLDGRTWDEHPGGQS